MSRFNANTINLKAGLDASGVATGVQKIEGYMGQLNTKIGGLSKQFSMLGNAIAGAFAVGAVGSAIQSTVNAASDLNETVSKTEQIFGSSANEIKKFAETAAESLGLSQRAAMDGAATFATFGKAAGLSGTDLTKFSTDLLKLSADLASFYNTSPEEAIVAIGAALRGESEPIRRYGVLLDDATLRQVALKNGITDTIKNALTPQQKALAANLAIFQQTTDAQGDFSRTSNGLANSVRILKAEFENVSAQIGVVLLPLLIDLANRLKNVFKYGVGGAFLDATNQAVKLETRLKNISDQLYAMPMEDRASFIAQRISDAQANIAKIKDESWFGLSAEEKQNIEFFQSLVESLKAMPLIATKPVATTLPNITPAISPEQEAKALKQKIQDTKELNKELSSLAAKGLTESQVKSLDTALALNSLNSSAQALPSSLKQVEEGLQKVAKPVYMEEFKAMVEDLERQVEQLITTIAVDFFATIGEALAGADNSFESFAGRALSTLGSFFKQIGGMFIAFGIAQLEFFKSLTTFNAPALIAAGAALAVIGGAITQASRSFAQTGSAVGYSSVPVSSDLGGYNFTGRVDGYDLVLVTDRNQRLMNRRG